MSVEATSPSPPEIADELAGWLVGGGILTTAFFPLALPAMLLTVATLLPLLLLAIPVGLVAAVVWAPITLVRRLLRALRAST